MPAGQYARKCLHAGIIAATLGTVNATQLRQALKGLGWTRKRFAKELEVNERTVRRWLSGESPVPQTVALAVAHLAHTPRKP
jgi:DNA-binding transcriptional regulator YiaG